MVGTVAGVIQLRLHSIREWWWWWCIQHVRRQMSVITSDWCWAIGWKLRRWYRTWTQIVVPLQPGGNHGGHDNEASKQRPDCVEHSAGHCRHLCMPPNTSLVAHTLNHVFTLVHKICRVDPHDSSLSFLLIFGFRASIITARLEPHINSEQCILYGCGQQHCVRNLI